MRKEKSYDSLLKRMRGSTSAVVLCAMLATSLVIMVPGSAFADSKLKAVVEDLLKRQADLELTQAALEQQITALELREILLLQRLGQLESKAEANREAHEAERENAWVQVGIAGAVSVATFAIASNGNPPSAASLANAKILMGDVLWEAVLAGDYTFLEFLASTVKDTDGDGIPDGLDLCPHQYGNLMLSGCPAQFSD